MFHGLRARAHQVSRNSWGKAGVCGVGGPTLPRASNPDELSYLQSCAVSKNPGSLFGGSYRRDYRIVGSIGGHPCFWNVPCRGSTCGFRYFPKLRGSWSQVDMSGTYVGSCVPQTGVKRAVLLRGDMGNLSFDMGPQAECLCSPTTKE